MCIRDRYCASINWMGSHPGGKSSDSFRYCPWEQRSLRNLKPLIGMLRRSKPSNSGPQHRANPQIVFDDLRYEKYEVLTRYDQPVYTVIDFCNRFPSTWLLVKKGDTFGQLLITDGAVLAKYLSVTGVTIASPPP